MLSKGIPDRCHRRSARLYALPVIREAVLEEWFAKLLVGQLPSRAAARHPDRVALYFEDARWTFAELSSEVDRVAKALMALGVGPGDKVAVWLNNMPQWIFLMFAIAKVGGIIVPLNTRYRNADFAYSMQASDSCFLFAQDRSGPVDYHAMIADAIPGLATGNAGAAFPALRQVVMLSTTTRAGTLDWDLFLERGRAVDDGMLADRAASVDPDAPLIIAFTSGTTGKPKGAVHSHICLRNITDGASRIGIGVGDALVNYLPLFHLFSYSHVCLMSLATGAAQILLPQFDADAALAAIRRHGGSVIYGFDTHFRDLLAAAAAGRHDLHSLRLGVFAAGQPGVRDLAIAVQGALCPTVSAYGVTEFWTAPLISFANGTLDQRTEASGYPLPGYEVRVVDPQTRQDVPVGCEGEILVRGYTMMSGYYRQPEATAAVIDADGWFSTGDAGLLRPDGHLRFIGRFKDMLKVGGENVAPAEIEGFLGDMDGVVAVAVVGAPDARLGEVPVAFVVPRDGEDLSLADIDRFCRGHIASFKIPRRLILVDALPMTATGKVQKNLLREQIPVTVEAVK